MKKRRQIFWPLFSLGLSILFAAALWFVKVIAQDNMEMYYDGAHLYDSNQKLRLGNHYLRQINDEMGREIQHLDAIDKKRRGMRF